MAPSRSSGPHRNRSGPDVVCLQEVPGREGLKLERRYEYTIREWGGTVKRIGGGKVRLTGMLCAGALLVAVAGAHSEEEAGGWRVAERGVLSEALRLGGWGLLFQKHTPPTRFQLDGDGRVEIETDDSVAFLFRALRQDELRSPTLSWRWKVVRGLTPANLRVSGGDDRPVAVHLWFDRPAAENGFLGRLKDGVAAVLGVPSPGKTLTYVWGGVHPRGERFASPYRPEDGFIVILRPGDTALGEWREERIDFDADFQHAFGYPPPPARYLAVSADSENAGGRSLAVVGDLTFETPDS